MAKDDNNSQAAAIMESIGMKWPQQFHCICVFLMGAVVSAHLMLMYYVDMNGDVVCRENTICGNKTTPTIDEWCNSTEVQSMWKLEGSSVMMEWNGACENQWLSAVSRSLFFTGWTVAVVLLGDQSDRFGRRKPVLAAVVALSITSFLTGCSPNILFYVASKFIHGMSIGCALLYVYVYGMELVPPSRGAIFGIVYFMIAAMGSGCMAILAWSLQSNWRVTTWALSIITIPFVCWPIKGPESPLWLISKNRIEEAVAVFELLSGSEGNLSHDFIKGRDDCSETARSVSVIQSLRALFSPGSPIKLMSFCWFGCALCYIGLGLGGATLPGDAYVNGALMSLVELPIYPILHLVLEVYNFSRMKVTVFTLSFGSICCFSFAVFPIFIAKWLAFVGLMFIAAAFTVIYIWSPEVFPFSVRATAMGFCVASGKLGSVIAPFVTWVATDHLTSVMVLYGSLSLLAAFTALLIPKFCIRSSPPTPAASENVDAKKMEIIDEDIEIC